MPKPPNTDNPPCPKCDRTTQKAGKTKAGTQRYKCLEHGYIPTGKPGRPLGDKPPRTNAERQRNYRQTHKAKLAEQQRERRRKAKEKTFA